MINITDADRKVAKKLAQFGKLIPEYKIAEIIAIEMQLERERAIKRRIQYESEAAAKLQATDRLAEAGEELRITTGNHMGHWDREGTRGLNCPVCQQQAVARDKWKQALEKYREATK
jgi:hypothetical protein